MNQGIYKQSREKTTSLARPDD